MYRAKENDLEVCVYDDELNEHSRDQLGLLGELRRAIDNDELVLHFQPKLTLRTQQFDGAEACCAGAPDSWAGPARAVHPGRRAHRADPAADRMGDQRRARRVQALAGRRQALKLAVNVSRATCWTPRSATTSSSCSAGGTCRPAACCWR
jgi:EAL domain-containing protein (putative c-di-GMP-specific phosphodiesterase class I)